MVSLLVTGNLLFLVTNRNGIPMAKQALTDTAIKQAKPREKPWKLADAGGLFLLIAISGGKWWRFSYRYGGKQKTISFGVYPDVGLAKARERRDAARRLLADDIDPNESRKAAITAKTEAASNSFEVVARKWHAKAYSDKTAITREQVITRLEQNAFKVIGAKPVSTITAKDVLAVIEKIAARDALHVAKRVFNYIGRALRYADSQGLVDRDVSASIDIKIVMTQRKEKSHAALIKPIDVGGLMRAIDDYAGSFTTLCALKLSALTFVRPGELRQAEWTEIDLDNATWNIPARKMKMKADHLVPLSTQAVAILREIKTTERRSVYVFPCERSGGRPMSENTVNAAIRRMGFTKEEATAHGFRATARTILRQNLGYEMELIEHQLAHAVKGANGRAYDRTSFLPERCEIMQVWANYLDELRALKT